MSHDIGIGRTMAYAIAVLDLDTIRRSTIRRLLPTGTTRRNGPERARARAVKGDTAGSVNRVSVNFGLRLKKFEDRGWVSRDELCIRVLDRSALLDCALGGETDIPHPLLRVADAIEEIKREQLEQDTVVVTALVEQRRRELRALARLMHGPLTGQSRRRRSVRVVHKSSLI